MAMEFVKCPTCGDEVSTRYKPVSCYKCGPFQVDPELLKADSVDPIESIPFWKMPAVLLLPSFVFVFGYQVVAGFRGSFELSVARALGAMVVYVPMMLIGYFIARALTKRSGQWQLVYIGILVAYWIIAPMLQRYGSGGSFF